MNIFHSSWECGSWIGAGTRKFNETTSCQLREAINLLKGVQQERGTASIPDFAGHMLYDNLDTFLARMSL